jgi:hypothetical protein
MASDPTPEERMDAFKRYLGERLFGLVADVGEPNDEEHYPQASGVVMVMQGFLVLVTVAHYLKDVMRWKEVGRLKRLSLLVNHESGVSAGIELDLDALLLDTNERADVGFVLLPTDMMERIRKIGGKITLQDQIDTPSPEITRYYLIGQAVAYTKIRQEVIATDAENKWVLNHIGPSPIAISSLHFLGEGDSDFTYRFAPHQGLASYSGCSGGPIFGFSEGSQIREYRLIGVQSKQILDGTRERKPKELVATSAVFAFGSIDYYLEELSRSLDSEKAADDPNEEGNNTGV